MSDLHRLIYTSRNLLEGTESEQAAAVGGILAASKRNNARVGVTGALLFNAGSFAQILEGPRAAVEATFERIQRDARHSEVSVLQCEPVMVRGFPNWAMAFVGRSTQGQALWGEYAEQTGFDRAHIEADRLFATLLTIVEREESEANFAQSVDPPPIPAHVAPPAPQHSPPPTPRGPTLDIERLRDALRDHGPEARVASPAAATPSIVPPAVPSLLGPALGDEAAVLRAALDEERGRTTALRRELDDARIALAAMQAEAGTIVKLSEIWAERARAMAGILSREPGVVRAAPVEEPQPGMVRPTLVRSGG